jgi:hypothetical protein
MLNGYHQQLWRSHKPIDDDGFLNNLSSAEPEAQNKSPEAGDFTKPGFWRLMRRSITQLYVAQQLELDDLSNS